MGIGPAPAIRVLLKRNKLALTDIARLEINEAFGAQYLAVEKELELDRARVNVNGGAIAIGHPLAASGVRLTTTAASAAPTTSDDEELSPAAMGMLPPTMISIPRSLTVLNFFCRRRTPAMMYCWM